jgi:hypothetical protein
VHVEHNATVEDISIEAYPDQWLILVGHMELLVPVYWIIKHMVHMPAEPDNKKLMISSLYSLNIIMEIHIVINTHQPWNTLDISRL